MANDAKKRISQFLKAHENDNQKIDKSLIKQLEQIDTAIQNRINNINEAKKICKENELNIKGIAKDAGLARKTVYNKPLLQEYIKERQTSLSSNNDSSPSNSKINKDLKEQLENANKIIDKFANRDIDTENNRQEIIKLHAEIENLQSIVQNLENQHEKDLKKIEELQGKLPPNIIPFGNENIQSGTSEEAKDDK